MFNIEANEFDAFGLEDEEINILRTLITDVTNISALFKIVTIV